MKPLSPARFVKIWQKSKCLTEVSARLMRLGYKDLEPDLVLIAADVLRRFGVRLKEMPCSSLPSASEEQRSEARRSPGVRWGFRKAA